MGYCRVHDRRCSYCLRSRTLQLAPTVNGDFEILCLKKQPRKKEKTNNEHKSWKNKKLRHQWEDCHGKKEGA